MLHIALPSPAAVWESSRHSNTNGCKFETCLSEPVVEGGQVDPTIMAMDKVYFDSEQLDNALIQQVASSCAHIVDVIKKGSARCTVLLQMPKI